MNYVQQLQGAYDAREARAVYMLVMEKAFGLSPTQVLMGKDKELSSQKRAKLENIVSRLLQGEPVQYTLGEADFYGHAFRVTPSVLIPRPETEDLVSAVLSEKHTPCSVLDIGTGSGCIAISLALEGLSVTAMDISEEAIAVASDNARDLNARVSFVKDDILHPQPTDCMWDAIVSNPPYVCRSEAAEMERHVLEHEPHLALFVPDRDPLLFYRAIAQYAVQHLCVNGRIYLECNRTYVGDVGDILVRNHFTDVCTLQDRYGNPRIVTATLTDSQT